METTFTCAVCAQPKPVQREGGTGYGRDAEGRTVCYACCGELDRKAVRDAKPGAFGAVAFYATDDGRKVANWPGSLTAHARATPWIRGGAFGGIRQRRVYWRSEGRRMSGTEYGGPASGNLLRGVRVLKGKA